MEASDHKTAHDNVPMPLSNLDMWCEKKKKKSGWSTSGMIQRLPRSFAPHLHQVVLGHGVRYPTDFVVRLEDVIVDLKFLSAIIPVKTEHNSRSGWLNRGQFNYQLLFARPGLTNEMITGANTSAGEGGGVGGMSPQWSKRINTQLWERGFGEGLTWWRQVRLCWW